MDKATKEDIYYQPSPVCAEIPNKESWHAFAEVKHGVNAKIYRTLKKLWQENKQELEPEDETKKVAF